MRKEVTAVASQGTDDGLPAVLLNFGASAQPPTLPLHPSEKTADHLLLRLLTCNLSLKQTAIHVTQMELTIDQALQQGVAAHKEGKLQDAERLYRAILQAQPNHPDANHNLGVIAVAAGKPLDAAPRFRLALDANPKIEQFWLSYIDVLMRLERFDEAKHVLVECEKSGVSLEKLGPLNQQLEASVPKDTNKTATGQTLSEKRKKLAEKNKSKKRKVQSGSSSAEPSPGQLNHLLGHYQAGRLEEAEALATLLTQQFPNHPFAWKALGVVLKKTGGLNESLLNMQKSAELSPQDAEAHCNLGVTLNELGRLDESETSLRQAIALKPDYAAAHNNLGNTLKELGKLDEAEASYRKAIALRADYAEAHNNLGITLQELGRLDESETSLRQAIALKPDYAEVHYNLGITLQELGRSDEAEASLRQAIALKPDHAKAHNNLGTMLQELGKLEEAEASLRQATALKPDLAEAHSNLGVTLKELGRLDESEASYRRAIALKPDYAEAHGNLGVTLKELGKLDEAIPSYARAITLKADYSSAYGNLGLALKKLRFQKENQNLYPILINLLTGKNFVRPADVAGAILSLLRLDNLIKDALLNTTAVTDIKEVDRAIKALAQVPLLHQLMRICPLPDLQLEALFVSIRRVLLINRGKFETSPEHTYFLSTLSLQCFTNEYVYFETEDETELVSDLAIAIADSIARASQPTLSEVLCLATYRPLHQYDWCGNLAALDQIPELKSRLIREPLAERVIAHHIPILAEVDDEVSRRVREQYEASPYPRWVKLGISPKPKSVAVFCDRAKLRLHSEHIKSVFSPSILIAGCGTGQHSIETASLFANCKVTAVDLSRASLAYAQRKTSELGITGIEYLQADILNLSEVGQDFDIIESVGVLHHMDDPMAGWRVLVDLLKTGGLMKIGLYSELARRDIVKAREEIALQEVGTSEAEIRRFRQAIAKSNDEHHQQLTDSGDFFSLSTLRDLIFHEQEHRFTLPGTSCCLDELGLKFCGFENPGIADKFQQFFGEEADICDLSLWHQFEESHPSTFAAMYQFWCQKM